MTSVLLTLGRCIRRKLELTAALIQEATQVLSSHPSLVAAALGILLGLLGLCALLGTSIVLLIATGSWQLEGGLVRVRARVRVRVRVRVKGEW